MSGFLEVGLGDVYQSSFLSAALPDNADMHAVSIGGHAVTEWEIDQADGKRSP